MATDMWVEVIHSDRRAKPPCPSGGGRCLLLPTLEAMYAVRRRLPLPAWVPERALPCLDFVGVGSTVPFCPVKPPRLSICASQKLGSFKRQGACMLLHASTDISLQPETCAELAAQASLLGITRFTGGNGPFAQPSQFPSSHEATPSPRRFCSARDTECRVQAQSPGPSEPARFPEGT